MVGGWGSSPAQPMAAAAAGALGGQPQAAGPGGVPFLLLLPAELLAGGVLAQLDPRALGTLARCCLGLAASSPRALRYSIAAPRQCCDRYTGYCSVHRGPFHRNASLCLEFANPWPADVWTVFGTPAAWAAAGASPWLGAGGALPLPTVSLQAVALRRGEDGGASVVCEGFSTELAAPLGAVCRNAILRCPALP